MKFIYYFYMLLIVLMEIIWVVLSSGNFEDIELEYVAQKLNPTECLELLKNVYLKKPINDEEYAQLETKIPFEEETLLQRQRQSTFLSPENCRIKLEEWIHNLPEKNRKWARAMMKTALRTLRRPDLAQYVKRNKRFVQYFEDAEENSRNSRNAVKSSKESHPGIVKTIEASSAGRKFKGPPREAIVPVYRTPAAMKALRGKSILEKKGEIEGAHSAGSERIEDDDSRTRWTAFLILLGIIVLTILATVFFALYKKNRGSFFLIGKKNCDDHYPLANRSSKKPPTPEIDVEQGSSTSCSPCGKKKRRGFSTEETSCSPSSFVARENKILVRKPKKKKFVRDKLNKRCAKKCDDTCKGVVVERGPASMLKLDKCTATKNRKCCEKSQCTEPPKPRLDLKTFHDKIANILRKDDNSCKCCKCNAFSEVNDCLCLNQTNKNMCTDENCHKFKLKSIAELCLSSDELSPIKAGEDDLNRKKRKKRRKDKDCEKDADMEKGCCDKSCTENSARSKDKKELKIKEKKIKKKKYNVEDDCKKKTCLFRKSAVEKNSHVDKSF